MSALFLTKHTVANRPAHTYFSHETEGGVMATSVLVEPQRNAIKPDSAPVASLREVTKKFGGQVALDRFSLQLHAGEVVALLGPNGAGKTTAVRLRLGLSQANSCEVKIYGGNPRNRASRLRL